jgi:hypothetical protein
MIAVCTGDDHDTGHAVAGIIEHSDGDVGCCCAGAPAGKQRAQHRRAGGACANAAAPGDGSHCNDAHNAGPGRGSPVHQDMTR